MRNDLCLTSVTVFGWCGVGEAGVRGVSALVCHVNDD